ncbi:hypothetical protein D3C71_1084800 [compost metagenome]
MVVRPSAIAWPVQAAGAAGGARDRNRTGTALRPRDFLTTSAFAASAERRSWSGARLHHSLAALGARRLLSTPSPVFQPGLGSALARNRSRAFAEFDGLHLWSFPQRAQISLSPLCLPISPLGRCAAHAEPAAGVTIPFWAQGNSLAIRHTGGTGRIARRAREWRLAVRPFGCAYLQPNRPSGCIYLRPNRRLRNPRGAAAASSAASAFCMDSS